MSIQAAPRTREVQPIRREHEAMPDASSFRVFNGQIGAKLRQAAALLAQQGANPFRISAYRQAGETISALRQDVRDLYAREGLCGLERLPGIGERRAELVRTSLAQMLARTRLPREATSAEPSVALLLEIDREYRDKAAAGELPTIAPKRFNPAKEAWLPILHTERHGWHVTAMFSNTARAHELGHTKDWVVMFFASEAGDEGQRTVVTETRGEMAGRRVVRGREAECHRLDGEHETAP